MGPKDAFNFFHSQIRINIECAFGMLVHCWAILRKPIAVNILIQRTSQLVRALCMLHNFCIDQNETKVPYSTSSDLLSVALESGDPNVSNDLDLSHIGGGHHFDNTNGKVMQPNQNNSLLPRNILLHSLISKKITSRPKPRGSTSTNT